jgi:hypothetical protein
MSITEILEKYNNGYGDGVMDYNIPALEADLEKLLEDRAIAFSFWVSVNYDRIDSQVPFGKWVASYGFDESELTLSELYALFLTNKSKTDE